MMHVLIRISPAQAIVLEVLTAIQIATRSVYANHLKWRTPLTWPSVVPPAEYRH